MNYSLKCLFLILLAIGSFIISNDTLEPNIMEARNFISAREILESGNWLTPTLNGELRIAKPPLPTWITAVFMAISPDPFNLFWLRLPAGIMAALMMVFIAGLSYEIYKNKNLAITAAAVFGSCALVIEMGKIGSWDIYAQSFLLAGIWAFVHGLKTGKTLAFVLAGLGFGLSFMSKGPVAHYGLLLPFLGAYIISFKNGEMAANKWKIALCALIFLIVSFWWPALIYNLHPVIAENVASTETSSWANRHVRPFYFYFHFPVYTGLWVVLIIASFFPKYAKPRLPEKSHYKFYLLWMLLSILLLTLIPEKKERYMIPAMVPMALMAANLVHYYIENRFNLTNEDKIALKIMAVLGSIALIGISIFTFVGGYQFGAYSMIEFILISLLLLSLIFLLRRTFLNKKLSLFFALLISVTVAFNAIAFPLIPNITDKNVNYHGIDNVRSDDRLKNLDLYYISDIHIKRVWEAGKQVLPFDFDNPPPLPAAILSTEHPSVYFDNRRELSFQLIDEYHMERQNDEMKKYIYILKKNKIKDNTR